MPFVACLATRETISLPVQPVTTIGYREWIRKTFKLGQAAAKPLTGPLKFTRRFVLEPGTMTIQWYPGHMAKARLALKRSLPSQDVIVELLDARMPYSSGNPIVTALRQQKPCLKILSKADLADPVVTKAWIAYFEAQSKAEDPSKPLGRVLAITSSTERFAELKRRIPELCQKLVGRPSTPLRPVRGMVVGIPNVGKSTLINALLGRKVAKTGDEPAVTKSQQQVVLPNGIVLHDNPGLLWPKIVDPNVGYRLAFGGAVSDAALDYEPVARYGAALLLERYPQFLLARYKLKQLPPNADDLLMEIGRRRGCLRGGGIVDLHKAADILIHEFRSGALGKISLETPEDALLAAQFNETASSDDSDIDDERVSDGADWDDA